MAENELEAGKEIEEKIVEELSRRHLQYIDENTGMLACSYSFPSQFLALL